jgi:hypothetical protein
MRKEPHQEKLYYFPYHWMMKGYLRVSMELIALAESTVHLLSLFPVCAVFSNKCLNLFLRWLHIKDST